MAAQLLGVVGYTAAAIAFAILAALLASRRRTDPVGALLLAAVIGEAVWAGVLAGAGYSASMLVHAAVPIAEAMRTLLWICFLLAIGTNRGTRPPESTGTFGAAGDPNEILSVAGRRALLIAVVLATLSAGCELIDAGPAAVYGARTLAAVFGLVCLEQVYRNTAQGRRWAIKYLAMGMLALFGFDLVLYSEAMMFARMHEVWWISRGYANALLMPLVAIAAARNPQWKLDVGVSRKAVFHSAALSLAGAYLLLVSAGGYWVRWFGGEWGHIAQALLVFSALLGLGIALASGTARARLRVFLAKHFFTYRFDYREEWLKLTRLLASGGPEDLPVRAIAALGNGVESPSGAIWLEDEGSYRFAGGIAWKESRNAIDDKAALVALLREREWIVDLERWRHEHQVVERGDSVAQQAVASRHGAGSIEDPQRALELPEAIAGHLPGWVIVPLKLERELIGFVVLDQPLAAHPLDWETLDLLKASAHQVASQIGLTQTLEKLIRAQQFDSFNRMSAFVVHDLKNLVAQLGLLTRNAQRHRDNPEFQADMLATVENVMERMQGLLLQLRAGTRPVEQPVPVKVGEVLESAVASRSGLRPVPVIDIGESAGSAAATAELERSPAAVVAHRDRLERVIGHLIQNAADACGPDGTVSVRLRKETEAGRALIEVEDNGCGMSETFIRDSLFTPFHSTKAHGMGIGAFESREYLREIGGSLDVTSREGVGTVFRIRLPLVASIK